MSAQDKARYDKLHAHVNMLAMSKTEAIVNPRQIKADASKEQSFQDQVMDIHKKAEDRFGERIALLEK